MYSQTEENYLKAIYKLSEKNSGVVNTNAIADLLQTKAASVTDMIKKLSEKKLLRYEKYKGVTLSDKGLKTAVGIIRKHRLWEVFLFEKLQFGWDEVHDIAEQLEHIQSPALIDKLDAFLGFPAYDPHGDIIPGKNGEFAKSTFQLLSEIREGQKVFMSGVVDHTPLFLQYLDKAGLKLSIPIEVLEWNAYDGSVTIRLGTAKTPVHLSKDVTRNILVTLKS